MKPFEKEKTMETARDVTYQLLREFGLTTICGNVGSTEETFLKDFPSDFRCVLALQESSVIRDGRRLCSGHGSVSFGEPPHRSRTGECVGTLPASKRARCC
jgi:hypothetical protein